MALRHADDDRTFLAIVFTVIKAPDSKRVFENCLRQLEAHTVVAEIGIGLEVVPFKFQIS